MSQTTDTTTIKAEVLRLLYEIGAMTVADLELCLPRCTRKQLLNAMAGLRIEARVHIHPDFKVGQRNPLYLLGEDPDRGVPLEAIQDRQYRLRTNPHLDPSWRPAADPVAAAWLHNPTVLLQPLEEPHEALV